MIASLEIVQMTRSSSATHMVVEVQLDHWEEQRQPSDLSESSVSAICIV